VTAKALATLDDMAGGDRVLLGIGVGWLAEEFAALGIPFDDRGPRTDDYVTAMRTLWSQDCATYDGPFASFRDVYCKPRPPSGRIPVIVGGDSRSAARRAGRLGDGYFPARGNPVELYDEMRRAAEAAGRDPDGIEISAAAPADPAEIAGLERSGVSRVMVPVTGAAGLPPLVKDPDEVLRYGREVIDRYGAA
jgi:alkanesulfonate monooxygenase SsuD/methylene tetrahydromethanopterin reductase-like flavin-dependent oxidoreductase (luciferase family)